MISESRGALALASSLAALAGFVDAIGFRSLEGFFVSFMSGNSTRLGVNIASDMPSSVGLIPLAIIGLFVVGVMIGAVIGHVAKHRRASMVMGFVTLALYGAALLGSFGVTALSVSLMALAMGAVNNIFVREGEVSVGVTYMTGALVKLGQRLAAIFFGGDKRAWIPYFVLWSGLILGVLAGSFSYSLYNLQALWVSAGFASVVFLVTMRG